MKYTFSDHFSANASRLSPAILAPGHLHMVEEFCSMFPFDAAADFGFETRLGNPEASCDFFMQIRKDTEGPGIIAGKSQVARLSAALLNNPFWQKISDFFSAWTDVSSLLNDRIESIWLEFDCMDSSYNPIPNIFFKITSKNESRESQWIHMLEILDEIYQILFGIKFPAGLGRSLKRCIKAIPPNGRVCNVGFMIPRKTEAVRFILAGLGEDSLIEYLNDIRWPGDTDVIRKMIQRYASKFDYAVFNLHIGKTVLPFLGMEMYLKELSQPQWDPRWSEIFDFLEAENLLLRDKREGLTSYTCKNTVSYFFPVHYFNGINHLKLVYKPGMPLECKGYFGTMINPH